MSEQRKRKDTETRRERGMQRKRRRTKKGGDTTGPKAREGDTRKAETATLKSTKETEERGTETESDTQTNIKKGRLRERDERGCQKGRRTKVLLLCAFICPVIPPVWTNIPVFHPRTQGRSQEAPRGEGEEAERERSSG